MKKLNNRKILNLQVEELKNINGGSWLSYIVGAAVATIANIVDAYNYTDEGHAVQQALNDFH